MKSIINPVKINAYLAKLCLPNICEEKTKIPIIEALVIDGSSPAKNEYVTIPKILNISAVCLLKNPKRKELKNPPTKVTFIPDAAITCNTPVVRKFPINSLGIDSLIPNTIPRSRLAETGGRTDLKKSTTDWRKKERAANNLSIGNARKFSRFFTALISTEERLISCLSFLVSKPVFKLLTLISPSIFTLSP